MSRTPMKLAEESKGKHWLTLVTTWSNRRLYTAFARASRALLACSTLSGTLKKTYTDKNKALKYLLCVSILWIFQRTEAIVCYPLNCSSFIKLRSHLTRFVGEGESLIYYEKTSQFKLNHLTELKGRLKLNTLVGVEASLKRQRSVSWSIGKWKCQQKGHVTTFEEFSAATDTDGSNSWKLQKACKWTIDLRLHFYRRGIKE